MNLLKLSTEKLEELISQATREQKRRAAFQATDFVSIKGNECAKHAALIALAGSHSIVFIGSHGVGKTMLRAAVNSIDPDLVTFEATPCPCGNHNNPARECPCTPKQISKTLRGIPVAEIVVEVCRTSSREMETKLAGTSTADILPRIEPAKQFKASHGGTMQLDNNAASLLNHAYQDMGLSPDERQTAIDVSKTIAALEESKFVSAAHIAEAINLTRRFK